MTNKISNPKDKKYDLLERTAVFGENIIGLTRAIKKDEISRPLISQLIRSSTSIGANYCEIVYFDLKFEILFDIGYWDFDI